MDWDGGGGRLASAGLDVTRFHDRYSPLLSALLPLTSACCFGKQRLSAVTDPSKPVPKLSKLLIGPGTAHHSRSSLTYLTTMALPEDQARQELAELFHAAVTDHPDVMEECQCHHPS